jgi:ribosomal protein L16/L10AE
MFELEGVTRPIAVKAMALAGAKLGIATKFVMREDAARQETPAK